MKKFDVEIKVEAFMENLEAGSFEEALDKARDFVYAGQGNEEIEITDVEALETRQFDESD